MRVAINQSNYIPWKGYFDLIHDADVFVFLDDVQFTKNDWRNRNKVKTAQGPHWLSIPVGDDLHRRIAEVALPDPWWQRKHWRTLVQLYGRAPYFETYRGFFEDVYLKRRWENLSELNQYLTRAIATDFLGIRTRFMSSSEMPSPARKQERVLSVLRALGARVYISGPAGKPYIDPARFEREGIELVWKDYSGYPEYPQSYPPFEHAVSVLDLLFHAGPGSPYYIWGWRAAASQPVEAPIPACRPSPS